MQLGLRLGVAVRVQGLTFEPKKTQLAWGGLNSVEINIWSLLTHPNTIISLTVTGVEYCVALVGSAWVVSLDQSL